MKTDTLRSGDFFIDSKLKLRILERNPQVPFPLHSHDFAELVIILSGRGIHFTEGAEYEVATGDVFVIESGFSHGYRELEQLRLYNIIFDPEMLSSLFVDISSMPGYQAVFHLEPKFRKVEGFSGRLRLSGEQLHHTKNLVVKIESELRLVTTGSGGRAMALAGLVELIVYFSRLYSQSSAEESGQILQMADLLAYLEGHLSHPITTEVLAAEAGMSPSTLNRAFHRFVDCSPIEYHLNLRIDHAAGLLKETGMAISEIAEASGFHDSNYFSRQFRKRLKMSPREYRRAGLSPK